MTAPPLLGPTRPYSALLGPNQTLSACPTPVGPAGPSRPRLALPPPHRPCNVIVRHRTAMPAPPLPGLGFSGIRVIFSNSNACPTPSRPRSAPVGPARPYSILIGISQTFSPRCLGLATSPPPHPFTLPNLPPSPSIASRPWA